MPWISLDLDKQLQPGDIIEIDFRTTNWVWSQAAEIALIEAYCDRRTDWEILSNSLPEDHKITFKIKILSSATQGSPYEQADITTTARIIGQTIITAGIVTWLVILGARIFLPDTVQAVGEAVGGAVERLEKTTGGKVALAGMGAVGIAILIAVVGKYLKLLR